MRRHGALGGITFLWAFVILELGSWFAMFTTDTGWLGSWRQAVDVGVGTVAITGPLLAGLVAGSYAGLRRTAFVDLVPVSARPHRGWFGPALRYWAAGSCALVVVVIAVTVRAAFLGVPLAPRPVLVVPLGIAVLGVHALIGMVIGLRVAPRAAAVLAAVVSFGAFLLATDHLAPPSFVTGGTTGPMYGEQYRLGSLVALGGFAVASFVTLAPWVSSSSGRQQRGRWTVSLVAVGLIIGLAQVTWPDLETRLEPSSVTYRCAGSGPSVCMVADRPAGNTGAIAKRLGTLAEPLGQVGAELPDSWVHSLPGQRSEEGGVLSISVEAELGGWPEDNDLLMSLTMPTACPGYTNNLEPLSSFDGRVRVMQWLTYRNGLGRHTYFPPWFSSKKAETWVRTTYDQLRRCDLDAVHRP